MTAARTTGGRDVGPGVRRLVVGALRTNCWILAARNGRDAVVIDPGGEPERIQAAAADLVVTAIVLTHTHWDHVLAVPALARAWGCDVHRHDADSPVWPHELGHLRRHGHFDAGTATADLLAAGTPPVPVPGAQLWSGEGRSLRHGQQIPVGDDVVTVLHTPGHTPGGVSLSVADRVFTGDTLFPGGPGLTGWPLSDFPTIIASIAEQLFCLPDRVVVHPGHGDSTTIGAQRGHLREWVARGW